jgi:RimJ/RimL family protein N-acetyltransferase
MHTEGLWAFLGGDPGNDRFNEALNRALFQREIIGQETPMLLCTCYPQDWGIHIRRVSRPRKPVVVRRRHYVCRKLTFDWDSPVTRGIRVGQMNPSLLDRQEFVLPKEVRQTLEKWRRTQRSNPQDFGFVAIHDGGSSHPPEIAACATVDAVVDGVGDMGIFTVRTFRQQGLATITAAAPLTHAFATGLSAVHWSCADGNLGSLRTAERLGLERRADYVMYCFAFDAAHHLAQSAHYHLQQKAYRVSAQLYEKMFAMAVESPYWAHHDAARVYAGLGMLEEALAHLRVAAETVWRNVDETETCVEF